MIKEKANTCKGNTRQVLRRRTVNSRRRLREYEQIKDGAERVKCLITPIQETIPKLPGWDTIFCLDEILVV